MTIWHPMQLKSIPNDYCQPPRVSLRFVGSERFVNNQNGGTRDNKGNIKIAPKNTSSATMTSNGRLVSHLDVIPMCCAALRQTPWDESCGPSHAGDHQVKVSSGVAANVVRDRYEHRRGLLRVTSGVAASVVRGRCKCTCLRQQHVAGCRMKVLWIHCGRKVHIGVLQVSQSFYSSGINNNKNSKCCTCSA